MSSVTNTTVIVQQPQNGPAGGIGDFNYQNEWAHGLFGCFDNCKVCLCAYFLAPCYMCYIHQQAGECFCTPVFCPGSAVTLRTKIRAQYKIRGSIWNDYLCAAVCGPCVLCQMANELHAQGIDV